jgi:hypothetical protein
MTAYERALDRIAATGATRAHSAVAAEAAESAYADFWRHQPLPTGAGDEEHAREVERFERLHAAARAARTAETAAFGDWLDAYARAREVAGERDAAAWTAYDRVWAAAEATQRELVEIEIEVGPLSLHGRATAIAAAEAFAVAYTAATGR